MRKSAEVLWDKFATTVLDSMKTGIADDALFEVALGYVQTCKLLYGLALETALKGRPRKRPGKLHADKGYDCARCRHYLRRRGITARIARKGIESRDRLGRYGWGVERTHAWFAGFGKLRIRFERRLDIHTALLSLAAAVI